MPIRFTICGPVILHTHRTIIQVLLSPEIVPESTSQAFISPAGQFYSTVPRNHILLASLLHEWKAIWHAAVLLYQRRDTRFGVFEPSAQFIWRERTPMKAVQISLPAKQLQAESVRRHGCMDSAPAEDTVAAFVRVWHGKHGNRKKVFTHFPSPFPSFPRTNQRSSGLPGRSLSQLLLFCVWSHGCSHQK